ncbi:MAG TPA: type II toxin-antitoxin system RelE/ParE family toxin [Crenotrichaceae bacterium]|nr:type II toxin-antitoxin system RelE/ParE family toxin [Crenotrichaceae bacterium]
MVWTVETLNENVDEELESLPLEMMARFVHIARLLEEFGPMQVREPHIKHIRGKLYEMRMRGKSGISRALYVTAKNERIVVVRVFIKKAQKTPEREIKLALKRAQEIEDND